MNRHRVPIRWGILYAVVSSSVLRPCPSRAGDFIPDYDLSVDEQHRSVESEAAWAIPDPDRCRCLASDGGDLWVGTTAGLIRWRPGDKALRLFKVDPDWGIEDARKAGLLEPYRKYDKARSDTYLRKWLRNVIDEVVVLVPGVIWAEMPNGAMVIRGEEQQVFATREEALALLHQTDLKPALRKLIAVDAAGHLWRTHQVGEFYRMETGIRRFDGQRWNTVAQPGRQEPPGSPIAAVAADANGSLWACGDGGIYRRTGDRWEPVDLGSAKASRQSFDALYVAPSGNVWAFGMGRLARCDGATWHVVHGQGRYRDFMLDRYAQPRRRAPRAWEAPDGTLWFDAAETGLIRFDGKGFHAIPRVQSMTAFVTSTDLGTFISSGERVFRYDDGNWRTVAMPAGGPSRPPWSPVAEALVIYDLLVADRTLYVATVKGLYRHTADTWDTVSFTAPGVTVTTTQPAPAGPPKQAATTAPSPASVEQALKVYVVREGKGLVDATNNQLAKDVVEGTDHQSSVISFYRLSLRDVQRAEREMARRIETATGGQGESWISEMQLAVYGPPAIKPLLKLATTGRPRQRGLAIGALSLLRDQRAAAELVKLARRPETDRETRVLIASAAVLAGDPEGIDLLIAEATVSHAGPDVAVGDNQQVTQTARDYLERWTRDYDDLPDDWSKNAWRAWWAKHRAEWTPGFYGKDALSPAGIHASHRLARAVAERLEGQADRPQEEADND